MPDAVLDAIESHRCTWMIGLPAMFAALPQHQRARARNIDSPRTCITAGDVPRQVQDEFPSVFGTPLRSTWAATEAVCGSFSYGLESGPVTRMVMDAQVCLVDDNNVRVPRGEVGDLVVHGPHVTIGYWAGPGLVDDALGDGWFHTGVLKMISQSENASEFLADRKAQSVEGFQYRPTQDEMKKLALEWQSLLCIDCLKGSYTSSTSPAVRFVCAIEPVLPIPWNMPGHLAHRSSLC